MAFYKTFITIEDPGRVVLSDLPFQQGQRVKVIILAGSDEQSSVGQQFHKLFRETQAIPGVSEIMEEEIAQEIKVFRSRE